MKREIRFTPANVAAGDIGTGCRLVLPVSAAVFGAEDCAAP